MKEISFRCRSPIFMCFECHKAENCEELMFLLQTFRVEDKKDKTDYIENFPFLSGDSTLKPESAKKQEVKITKGALNELSGEEWLKLTSSLATAKRPNILGHQFRRSHPESKSPYLIGELISLFTHPGDLILDPMAGTGTTLLTASLLNRYAIGIEIEKKWFDIYEKICCKEKIKKQKFLQGDALSIIKNIAKESVDFVIIDPPEIRNILKKTTKTKSANAGMTDGNPVVADFSMSAHTEEKILKEYFYNFTKILLECFRILKKKKYCAVIVRNFYKDGKYYLLTDQFVNVFNAVGYELKGEKIWENKSSRLQPLGYPHTYIPNVVHYAGLIFQKTFIEKRLKYGKGLL